MNEKALNDDSNSAREKIDCIHFAKLSLYSVNTARMCKICRLRSYCIKKKEKKKKSRIVLGYLYWVSFYCTRWGR